MSRPKRGTKVGLLSLVVLFCFSCARDRIPDPPVEGPPEFTEFQLGVNELIAKGLDSQSFDGKGNNRSFPEWGAAETPLLQFGVNYYSDGRSTPTNKTRDPADPRRVSNTVHTAFNNGQKVDIRNSKGASDFLWLWGQFIDHDLDLTGPSPRNESLDIGVPTGDLFFDPMSTGTKTIPFKRSNFTDINGVRFQINSITSFIDASNVYGSSEQRSRALRAQGGNSPYLETSSGNFLPFNLNRLMNEPADDDRIDPTQLFIAGDVRANENVALAAMHTLFMREHNFIVGQILGYRPQLDRNLAFEIARRIVAAEIQAITYREFLPILLGEGALPHYRGYNASIDAGIHSFFSTVAFRVGHTMVSEFILRRDSSGNVVPQGDLRLRDAFFVDVPGKLQETGLEPLFIGLNRQTSQAIDVYIIDELRNFLFGSPGSGGLDLASLNIQRARDHGLPLYNEARKQLGLFPAFSFSEISSDPIIQNRLAAAYASPDHVDPWTGGLAEDHVASALVGPTFWTAIRDQFLRVRDGDRFWYQNYLPPLLQKFVESSTLTQIIRRNTNIRDEIPESAFRAY